MNCLNTMKAGFNDVAFGSQEVFRAALEAMSRPGHPVGLYPDLSWPSPGHATSAALFLGLLDADTTLWMSPGLVDSEAAAWLRFHTGCVLVKDIKDAQFLWILKNDPAPPFTTMCTGTDEYPDQSATCVVEVDEFSMAPLGWRLHGPGIEHSVDLNVSGIGSDFLSQWQGNHAIFPRGVDVYLTSATHIVGLPRTTLIQASEV